MTYLAKVLHIKLLLEQPGQVLAAVYKESLRAGAPDANATAGWCELAQRVVDKHVSAIATGLAQQRSGMKIHAILRTDADDNAYSEVDLTWSEAWTKSGTYKELLLAVRNVIRHDRLVANQEDFQAELVQAGPDDVAS